MEARDRLFALLDEQIAATRADLRLAERADVLAMLVQARDEDGNALSADDLRDDLVALIAAGHETTASAIAWGAVLLAHNPSAQDRATLAARDNDEQYLGALVKEVLRIRPPLPGGTPSLTRRGLRVVSGTDARRRWPCCLRRRQRRRASPG